MSGVKFSIHRCRRSAPYQQMGIYTTVFTSIYKQPSRPSISLFRVIMFYITVPRLAHAAPA